MLGVLGGVRYDLSIVSCCVGDDLDLYIKDSDDDDGAEPNPTTDNMWTSPDIWIRNNNDNGLMHQNPEYRTNGNPNLETDKYNTRFMQHRFECEHTFIDDVAMLQLLKIAMVYRPELVALPVIGFRCHVMYSKISKLSPHATLNMHETNS